MKTNLLFPAVAMLVISACTKIAPSADHHQHLMSPTAAAVSSPPPLPAVQLPRDIALLLTQRADRTKDPAAIEDLYTKDAWVLRYSMPGWERGTDALSRVPDIFPSPYTLTPVLFRTNGSTSSVAGYYTRGGGEESPHHFAYFHMTVERSPDGVPRIASETPSFPIPPIHKPVFAGDLIRRLDGVGIQRAVVLSNAYLLRNPLVWVTGRPPARASCGWRDPERQLAVAALQEDRSRRRSIAAVTVARRC